MLRWNCLLLFFCLSAHAEKFDVHYNRPLTPLVSFEDLYYMPPKARIAYLHEIRLALAEMERAVAKKSSDRDGAELEQLKKYFAEAIRSLNPIEAAFADDSGCMKMIFKNGETVCVPADSSQCASGTKYKFQNPDGSKTQYCIDQSTLSQLSPETQSAVQSGMAQLFPQDVGGGSDIKPVKYNPETKQNEPVADSDKQMPHPDPKPMTEDEKKKLEKDGVKTKPDALSCNRDTARDSFYKNADTVKSKNCLMGGNFSAYNGEIKVGNCKRINSFPAASKAKGADTIACKDGKNICNPMLYCGTSGKDGKFQPICEKISQDLTKACENDAPKDCDPFAVEFKGLPIAEEWKEFKTKFDALCGKKDGAFVSYFCEECNLMNKRVQAADASYNKNKGKWEKGPQAPAAAPATPAQPESK